MSNDDDVRDTDPTGRYVRVRKPLPFLSEALLSFLSMYRQVPASVALLRWLNGYIIHH